MRIEFNLRLPQDSSEGERDLLSLSNFLIILLSRTASLVRLTARKQDKPRGILPSKLTAIPRSRGRTPRYEYWT